MKRYIAALLAMVLTLLSTACGADGKAGGDGIDYDLTQLSETVMFAEVNRMQIEPDKYAGKTVRVSGSYGTTTDEDGRVYHACVFTDSTACCTQVFEFVPAEGAVLPEVGSMITVTGRFEAVIEGVFIYLTLFDAVVELD